jgi:hypothetical protein
LSQTRQHPRHNPTCAFHLDIESLTVAHRMNPVSFHAAPGMPVELLSRNLHSGCFDITVALPSTPARVHVVVQDGPAPAVLNQVQILALAPGTAMAAPLLCLQWAWGTWRASESSVNELIRAVSSCPPVAVDVVRSCVWPVQQVPHFDCCILLASSLPCCPHVQQQCCEK